MIATLEDRTVKIEAPTVRLRPIDLPVIGAVTWAGLMATVALPPRGEEMMFPLNAATVTITFVGHVIFGLVLGLAFAKAPRGGAHRE